MELRKQLNEMLSYENDSYSFHIRDFIRWAFINGNKYITPNLIEKYFMYLNTTNYSSGTKKIKRQAVKKRIRDLEYNNNLDFSSVGGADYFFNKLDFNTRTKKPIMNDIEIKKDKYLTIEEIKTLLHNSRGVKQNLIIKFLWATGCRVGEMINITLSNCSILMDCVKIRIIGNSNKERYIYITIDLYNKIIETFDGNKYLFETSTGQQYVRTAISDQLAKVTKRVLGKKCRAHTFRHSFATHKIREGVPLSYISKYLGHSSIAVTADMYDHGFIDNSILLNDEIKEQ